MRVVPDLYPPRERATNVELIRAVRAAASQAAFEAADAAVAANLHPSLIAELDLMEMTMPAEALDAGRRLVDGLFLQHLPALVEMRRAELDLDDESLLSELAENAEFYRYVVEELPESLGSALRARLESALQTVERDREERRSEVFAAAKREAAGSIAEVTRHREWIPLLAATEIRNAMAHALDRPASRGAAKQFIRAVGGVFPELRFEDTSSPSDRDGFVDDLRALSGMARAHGLLRLAALCEALADGVADVDVTADQPFPGERAVGFGPCERCSMTFASSAIVSFDPSCPRLFDGERGRIYLPLEFNIATCPFCGHEARIDAPSMFYSPVRRQVIYNLPTRDQFAPEEAPAVYRDLIQGIRERFMSRVDDAAAREFEHAVEEFTYSVPEFMIAIQMGTTAYEEHVWVLARLSGGTGLLTDPTKGVIIELTRSELASRWGRALEATVSASPGESPGVELGETARDAMKAFDQKDYSRAREILEGELRRNPSDQLTRRNLAAVYVALDDRDAARELLTTTEAAEEAPREPEAP